MDDQRLTDYDRQAIPLMARAIRQPGQSMAEAVLIAMKAYNALDIESPGLFCPHCSRTRDVCQRTTRCHGVPFFRMKGLEGDS